jgi:hypothetical protein
MKTAKRVQLLLSPVLIAMLTIMLAVVSFGWYQANANTDIEVKDASVSITVEEPEGIEVAIRCIGDDYSYTSEGFNLTSIVPLGYFGQTGEYPVDSLENDRPYILFFEVSMTSSTGIYNLTSAFVDSVQIKKGNETLLEKTTFTQDNSKFKVKFYTASGDDINRTLSNEDDILTLNQENKTYMGIHFVDSNPDVKAFEYSDIKYYGSTYKLGITFVEE